MTDAAKKALDKLKDDPLFEDSELYFIGGTALAYYLDHRISYDIDIISAKKLPVLKIKSFAYKNKAKLIRDPRAAQHRINTGNDIEEYSQRYTYEGIKLEFFYSNSSMRNIIVNEAEKSLYDGGKLLMLDLKSIAMLKVMALLDRGKSRDYYDVYFLLKHEVLTLEDLEELWNAQERSSTLLDHLARIDLSKDDESLDFLKHQEDYKTFRALDTKAAFLKAKALLIEAITQQEKKQRDLKDKALLRSQRKR